MTSNRANGCVRIAWWLVPSIRVVHALASFAGAVLFLLAGEGPVVRLCRRVERAISWLVAHGAHYRIGDGRWHPAPVEIAVTHDPSWRLW